VIGVVFRGSLWFDGLLTCEIRPGEPDCVSSLVRAIVRSKQYSQIHAAILSREDLVCGIRIDGSDLSRRINLPVVSISRDTARSKPPPYQNEQSSSRLERNFFSIEIAGGLVTVKAAGIGPEETREIFAVACASGQRIPEAVRVAKIVAMHVTGRGIFPQIKQRLKDTF
jgi:endonuclease V-like protein UPF0215 family